MKYHVSLLFAALASALVQPTKAAEPSELDDVMVSAARPRSLDAPASIGSRLGLTVRETPGTLESIDLDQMLGRGLTSIDQAASSLPGVLVGGTPGNLLDFSMRGFTGQQVVLLYNGLYLGPSNMTNRPGNTFNLQRVELLKGPASVLYGQGAIGGAINVVNKAPSFTERGVDLFASVGSFGTTSLGLGGSGQIGDSLAYRIDFSRYDTDGFVRDTPADSTNLTASVAWKLGEHLDAVLSFDYLRDNPSPYWGTPLVTPAFATQPLGGILDSGSGVAIDRRTRFVNYNVADYRTESEQFWPKLAVDWRISDSLALSNVAYWFSADRTWINSEVYDFNETTQRIDRDRFFVLHDQELYGDLLTLTHQGELGDRSNRLALGAEFSHLDFVRRRGFPDGDSVDPFNSARGVFGPLLPRVSPTKWDRYALFFEDALDLTASTKLVTGGRWERIELDRKNFNANGSFNAASSFRRNLAGSNWRVGLVHHATATLTAYVSFNTGQDPVGANIFLVNAGQNFALSDARQLEAGVKYASKALRADFTAALFDIRRENILTQINSVGDLSNVGSQRSRGFEFTGNWQPLDRWTLSGSLTWTDAQFDRFVDPDFGIDASGNTPANVPEWTARLWTSRTKVAGLPLEVGGGLNYVGAREANTANSFQLQDYTLVDAYANWRFGPGLVVTGRVSNLFDRAYGQWADVFYPTALLLGMPRRFELALVARF